MNQKKQGLPPEAYAKIPGDQYEPYVPKTASLTSSSI